jgi:hypothetical protein
MFTTADCPLNSLVKLSAAIPIREVQLPLLQSGVKKDLGLDSSSLTCLFVTT